MTIGLYDIDFWHSSHFSISLPLMKVYHKLYNENHHVIMMKALEKTGRYNKIIYFKENPKTIIPKSLHIDYDKGIFLGYGFCGEMGLTEKTKPFSPSFTPYDLFDDQIKNKTLYDKIKRNSLINWRENDFSGYYSDKKYVFVYDHDFLKEENWQECFENFKDHTIEFIKTVQCENFEQFKKFYTHYQGRYTTVKVPYIWNEDQLRIILEHRNIIFKEEKDISKLFLQIFGAKIITSEIHGFIQKNSDTFHNNLIEWSMSKKQESFKDFMGEQYDENDYLKFSYRLLLKQNPQTYSFKKLLSNI